MSSTGRARSCICLCRSWRTAFGCLQPPRLVLALSIIYIILHSSQSQAKRYEHSMAPDSYNSTDVKYYTTGCNSSWCGESWPSKKSRILRYTYTVVDRLELKQTTTIEHNSTCAGAKDSSECKYEGHTVRNETRPVRITTVERSKPDITEMPVSNLYLITTDGINKSADYSINQDKIWQIHIPKGCKMSVHFSQFDLEDSDRCEKDSFTVQTSKYQPSDIHKYCNNLNWIELKRERRVQMKFHSDASITRGGIHAVACISSVRTPSTQSDLNAQLPCTCDPSMRRRRKNSQSYKTLKDKIALEEKKVSDWLHLLMEGGQDAVDAVLRNPESPKQRHLANLYQEVLSKHRVW